MKPPTLIEHLERELENHTLIAQTIGHKARQAPRVAGTINGLQIAIKHAKREYGDPAPAKNRLTL